jgi:hypothetical protein
VFDKALDLYRQAMKLDPQNFPLATDYAQSYYGIRPLRTNDALVAWTNALHIARDELEREGVYIHLARVKISIGRFAEAQAHLDAVTNAALADMRNRLQRNLNQREHPGTNSVDEEATSSAMTNPPVAATHQIALRTNAVPALRNPPASTPDTASTMANVPPDPPAATKPPAAPIVSPEQKP